MSENFRNPLLTVDIIIELADGSIVLIERKNPPHGWALPGGFVDYGECIERAAVREAKEETSLEVTLTEQFYTYSDPARDPPPSYGLDGFHRDGARCAAGSGRCQGRARRSGR